jgi:hypothetical protein
MTVPLQIVVSDALRGMTYAVQVGRDGLMHTTDRAGSSLIFDPPVTLREDGRGLVHLSEFRPTRWPEGFLLGPSHQTYADRGCYDDAPATA